MPAIYDSASGRATTRRGARKPKPKPPLVAPQIKKRPSSSSAVTHVPGVGAVTRPTPRMQQAARTVAKAKPAPKPGPRKPTAAEVQRSAAKTRQLTQRDRANKPALHAPQIHAPKQSGPFTSKPVEGMLGAERRAISSLASLHQQNPKKYEDNLAKKGIGEGRTIAGPRGQTVERFKGRTVGEVLADRPVKKLPKKKDITVAAPRGQGRSKVVKANTVGEVLATAGANSPKNLGDIVQDAPTSLAHTVKTAVTDPKQAAKDFVQPYIDIVKDPTKELAERPLTTALTVTPLGKAPGLIAGKAIRIKGARAARKAGRTPSNARPDAELPGTALRERRAGSRSAEKRWLERREDRKAGPAKTTVRDTERRVDEFWDLAQKRVIAARDKAAGLAKDAGLSPAHTEAVIEHAGQRAKHANDEHFAREFGANERPDVGAHERAQAAAQREESAARVKQAADEDKAARAAADAAHAADRVARRAPNPRLAALEAERVAAYKALAAGQGAHTKAQAAHGKAEGAARASQATEKTSPELSRLLAERKAIESGHTPAPKAAPPRVDKETGRPVAVKPAPKPVTPVDTARKAVSDADRHVNHVVKHGTERVAYARAAVTAAERTVDSLERQLARAEETASRLQGRSEGLHKGGKMDAATSKRIADQQERIGLIHDALADARLAAKRAREQMRATHDSEIGHAKAAATEARDRLKAAEAEARAGQRARLANVNARIADERRRIGGVAPREAERMRGAIESLDEAGGLVRSQRQTARDLDRAVAEERARFRSAHMGPSGATQNARIAREQARARLLARQAEHSAAKQAHQEVKTRAANSVLSDAAAEGRIFEHSYDAQKVKERLNAAGHEIEVGSGTAIRSPVRFQVTDEGRTRPRRSGEVRQPVKFKVIKVGDRFAVVPEIASHRRYLHDVVGTSKATNAMLLRDTRKGLTTATLPFSLKWLGGQAGEAGLRSLVSGAGALDYYRLRRVVARMNEIEPGAGDAFLARLPGTHFNVTGEAHRTIGEQTLAERYQGRWPEQSASALTWMGQTLPGRGAKAYVRFHNRVVLGKINNAIENTAISAMAGHAIKRDFMNERTLGLTEKAIDEAARGLMDTPNQIAAARAVMDDYGKYSNFSPELRNAIMHWTPYLPWYLNTIRFLRNTIRDHPIKTSMFGAMTAATEEWRAEHGLSAYADDQVEDWQRGSYPIFGDKLSRIGQFTPFGAFSDPAASLGGLGLPQALGTVAAGLGVDFTGRQLRDSSTGLPFNWKQKVAKGVTSGLESQVPALGLGLRLSGLGPRYIDRKDPTRIAPFKTRLGRELPLWPLGDVGSRGGGGGGLDDLDLDMGGDDVSVDDLDLGDLDLGG